MGNEGYVSIHSLMQSGNFEETAISDIIAEVLVTGVGRDFLDKMLWANNKPPRRKGRNAISSIY